MSKTRARVWTLAAQVGIVVVFLALWEWVPQVGSIRELGNLFDPFYISSPSKVADQLYELLVGDPASRAVVWEYIYNTMLATVIGMIAGLVTGGAAGLLIGSSARLARVFRPFAVAMNAVPRIALIPVVVVIMGSTLASQVVIAVLVVFFVAFFNAYEGAASVKPELVQNARVFEGSPARIMLQIRAPFAMAWTLAILPLAGTFALLTVVTGEILTGYPGLGRLIADAQATADATLTFAIVVVLSVLGLLLVGLTELIKRRVLHWWGK